MTTEIWRTLRVGDTIRIREMPNEVWASHGETKELFEYLVAFSVPAKVCEVDDGGYPWIELERSVDGELQHEFLMIHHNDIEIVSESKQV